MKIFCRPTENRVACDGLHETIVSLTYIKYIVFSTGLTLELNIEQYEYVSQLSQEAGIRAFVSTQNEMPFPYELGISAAPGYSTSIQLRKVHLLMNSYL